MSRKLSPTEREHIRDLLDYLLPEEEERLVRYLLRRRNGQPANLGEVIQPRGWKPPTF